MATVFRPCYCTREEVRRASEFKYAAYANERIDRAILSAADAVEGLTQRRFYPEDRTVKKDWPNFQYAYPWRVWLDKDELAAQPTQVVTGSLNPVPTVIPSTDYIAHPINTGPPFRSIELRRDKSSSFGAGSSPQLDIGITGTFGYWTKTRIAGALAADMTTTTQTTASISNSALVGVGDILICGTERMIVQDAQFVNTAAAFSGLSSASAADKIVSVVDGTQFGVGEVLLVDSEWVLIEAITGNNLIVRRAWDASVLAVHTSGTLWARRLLTVLRGQLGTISATHTTGAVLSVSEVPGLIRELAIAEAEVFLAQETGGYGEATPKAGPGLPDIRQTVINSVYTRKARVFTV